MEAAVKTTKFNEIQISLLRMFDRNIPEKDIVEIRDLMVEYFSEKLLKEVDEVIGQKGITEADFEALKHRHYRTKAN